jgi:hypothetical protein
VAITGLVNRHADPRLFVDMRMLTSPVLGIGALVLFAATACAGSSTATEPSIASPTADSVVGAHVYQSERFVTPLKVTVPAWLPAVPNAEEPNFLTWIGDDASFDRAVRFLVPVNVYQPGSAAATPPPDGYLSYLRGHVRYGAQLADETTTSVDGMPTTIVTATTAASLDGSLGCPAADVPAPDCFGLQSGMALRLAVIEVADKTLVAWARVTEGSADAAEVFADFEQMLVSLQFR